MAIEIAKPSLLFRQLIDRDTFTYTYLLVDPESRQGVIIDPVKEQFERDINLIKELGVELMYVLETHVHADHVTSAGLLRQQTGAKIVFNAAADVKAIDVGINDGETLTFGAYSIKAITTPGHTSGCISYYVDQMLFSGDALLIHGCGRTDFQQGDAATLYQSVTQKLFSLPDETLVYPAHDYNGLTVSTIGAEKRWNPRLGQGHTEEDFVQHMRQLKMDLPKRIHEALPENMECGVKFDPQRYLVSGFGIDDLYQAWQNLKEDEVIVDNRSPEEYEAGHVPSSKNIPFGAEAEFVDDLKRYSHIFMYCRSGRRAQTAMINLSLLGVEQVSCVSHGGIPDWVATGYPLSTTSSASS